MTEIFKSVKGYENLYEVSNLGRVKSLAKSWVVGRGLTNIRSKGITYLSPGVTSNGYLLVALCNKGITKTACVHLLIWDHFGDGDRTGMKIHHKDGNPLNARIDNLEMVTQQEHMDRHSKTRKKSSKYNGVSLHKKTGKWTAYLILSNKKVKYIGEYETEEEAFLARKCYLKRDC